MDWHTEDTYSAVEDFKVKPLWWQKEGLQQTASGYGSKLATQHMAKISGRWHRIYIVQYSNIGTPYVIHNGKKQIINVRF